MTRVISPLRAATVVLLATLAALMTVGSTSAVVDLTGTWDMQISGDFGPPFGQQTLNCTAEFEQTGDDLEADFECGIGSGTGTATITQQDEGADIEVHLDLQVTGLGSVDADAVGTVAPDGNSMEGTWTSETFDTEGTFSGERQVAQFFNGDLNCDGNIDALDALTAVRFDADAEVFQHPDCPALDAQFGTVIFGDITCTDGVGPADALLILRWRGGIPLSGATSDCPNIGDLIFAPN